MVGKLNFALEQTLGQVALFLRVTSYWFTQRMPILARTGQGPKPAAPAFE